MITSKQVDILRKVEFGENVTIPPELISAGYVTPYGRKYHLTEKGALELRKHPGAPEASELGGT